MSNTILELVKALNQRSNPPMSIGNQMGNLQDLKLLSDPQRDALAKWNNPYLGTPQHRPEAGPFSALTGGVERLGNDLQGLAGAVTPQAGAFDFLRGPAKAAGDAIGNIWNSPFIQGADPIQGPDLPGQSYAERSQPESLDTNFIQAEERLRAIPGKIGEFLSNLGNAGSLLDGPSDPYQGPPPPEPYKVPYTLDFGESEAAPVAAGGGGAPAAGAAAPPPPLATPKYTEGPPAFDEAKGPWEERLANLQTALGGLARGAAMPLPVGGGSTGLLLARSAAGMQGAFDEKEALGLEADRYADALGLQEAQQGVSEYNAESGRISALARRRAADAQLAAALTRGSKVDDPRKQQAKTWHPGPGATIKEQIIGRAKDKAVARLLPDNYNKMLHGFAEASLSRTFGEDWKTQFEFSDKRQEVIEDALANEVGTILSTKPELLLQMYPEIGPDILELQAALAGLGGAGVEENK